MRTPNERGIALVLALFLVAALSVLGASLMILSQTETYASMNYRMMSQARYAAESGVHKGANFLLDPTQYQVPRQAGSDPWANYVMTASPVTYLGQPVVLSSDATFKPSNYPYAAAQTAFAAAFSGAAGTLTAEKTKLTFKAYAILISMTRFDSYGGTTDVVQTWEITAAGGLTGSPKTNVEVVALIETPKVAANPYAAFATANTCDAIYFHGNVTVDSYDSSMGTVAATTEPTGGDIGSNGNVHVQGSVNVAGNLYTPRTGVGACTAGAVNGLTGVIGGNMVALPTDVVFPLPVLTATPPTTAVTINAALMGTPATACASLGTAMTPLNPTPPGVPFVLGPGPAGNCTVSGTTITIDNHGQGDITMPTVTVAGGYTLKIAGANTPGQNVNINALIGSGTVEIDANTTGVNNQSVVLKVAGMNADGTEMAVPLDLGTMSWKQNAATTAFDASSFQIVYGGSANISMQGGNSQSAATVYAPNASFTMIGTQDFYGSILAKTINNNGNTAIHYDRRLGRDFWVAGHPMIGSFTWKRY